VSDPDAFATDLEALGYRVRQERGTVRQFALQASPYLVYAVHWDLGDGSVLFSWEFAIGAFMAERGLQVGSNEELNTFLFPQHDARGEQDIAFVVQEMDRAEAILRTLDFLEGA
jgi:hypothetical protein